MSVVEQSLGISNIYVYEDNSNSNMPYYWILHIFHSAMLSSPVSKAVLCYVHLYVIICRVVEADFLYK